MTDGLTSFAILNSLDVAYFETDIKGTMLNCNQSFLDKAELQSLDIIGTHYRRHVDPKQVTTLYNDFNFVYRTGEPRRILINFIRHKTGGFRTAEGVVGPIKTPNGEVIGFRGMLFDVTERIKNEMEMLAAKQAAEKELSIGRTIQFSFLPSHLPKVAGWELDARFHSARDVAGDFYDVFPMSNGTRLGFVVADVCDKGVGAALYMAIFRTMLHSFAGINTVANLSLVVTDDPSAERTSGVVFRKQKIMAVGAQPLLNAINMTNQYIARNHGSSNMFATVFFGVLNPQDGKLIYVNAGHEPPIIVSAGKDIKRLDPTGPAVGLMEDLKFDLGEIELGHGDLLFAYTDGVIDALNINHESFTEERLLKEITQSVGHAGDVLHSIMASLHTHIADQDQYDDITLLGLYRQ